ncbi:MAG TPA: hypothetical protein VHI78_07430 [Bacteroidales bacterium]|jgi:hypothetical protein|nr:hypothetical protein [Bacteroidales bacterium]
MKPHRITLINALTLIILGLWGYFSPADPSFTALIPVFAGVLLLAFVKGMKESNKVIAHITVFLTLILLIALIKPLTGSLSRNDPAAITRVLIMMVSCMLALAIYIKSFIEARKQRSRI